MLSFTRHIYAADLLEGFSDTHCHLLPGVDDGAEQTQHTFELLAELERAGVARLYLTPHIKAGRFANEERDLRERYEELKAELASSVGAARSTSSVGAAGSAGCRSGIELRLAAEYFTDSELLGHIQRQPLTFADSAILTEFSFTMLGVGSLETLFVLSMSGYQVIIAHPERYMFLTAELLDSFRNSGYKLQLTIPSLIGFYGKKIQQTAIQLLSDGVYSYLGSDIHNAEYIEAMRSEQLSDKLFNQLVRLKENNLELY